MADSARDSVSGSLQHAKQATLAAADANSVETLVILNVCETAQGGVGRYQDALATLTEHGFAPHVLLPDSDTGILDSGIPAATFTRSKRGAVAMLHLIRSFFDERHRLRPDLYFFHSTFALLPLLLLRVRGDKTPAVYCAHCWAAHSGETETLKKKIIRQIEGHLCGLADLTVNVSHADADTARAHGYRGHHVVVENAVAAPLPNAQDDLFQRPTDTAINLLFVGRFDRQKGLDVLLEAFQQAHASNAELHLHLVGEPLRGGDMPEIPGGVTHHGWVAPDQIDHFYRSADALVVPSRWEGLPLVIPEAYRNGTPVLVARTSGMEHLVAEGETGHSFELTAEALGRLLASLDCTDLRNMRPKAAELYKDRFAIDRFSHEMATHLRALVEHKGGQGK